MKSLPFLFVCAPLLAITSCKTGEAQQFRLMYAQTNAEDDSGAVDAFDIDQAGGVELQIMGAFIEGDDTLYGVGGLGYQTVNSELNITGGEVARIDIDADRLSFHGGVEKQFPINEAARFLIQVGVMYNELGAEIGGIEISGDALGLYAALGLQVQFTEGVAGMLMYRLIEPSVDLGVSNLDLPTVDNLALGDIDTDALLIGITLIR